MMLKVILPKDAKLIRIENNELILELSSDKPTTTLSMFTVMGNTLDEFYSNPSITNQDVSIHRSGVLEPVDPVPFSFEL